ncbi:MAG: hemerythrin domain-containing protein, partial [Dehalococcoidia bacterium]|nr:hemerythrin domain-containing protein [Dehalococcoidia bacterium]
VTKNPAAQMKDLLDTNIKDVIQRFPGVADVLNEYRIACVSCGVGTCLFKDVVAIHDLSSDDEKALMSGIARKIFPGSEVTVPTVARKHKPAVETRYSPPMEKLVDEHRLIKRWLALIPAVCAGLDLSSHADRQLAERGIDFIRSYADRFHHAKEEAILFKYFDQNLDIIRVMYADHEKGRALVRFMLDALGAGNREALVTGLKAYRELLTEHIKKEDEALYRWMDRNLSTSEIGKLFAEFASKDAEFGEAPKSYEGFVSQVEAKYIIEEEQK